MQTLEIEARGKTPAAAPLAAAPAQAAPLKDYSVLLGLAAVGSVLFVQSIGTRLASEIGAWLSPAAATPH